MRIDEFVLRVSDDDDDECCLQIRFHERLTVLAGLGAMEREAIVEAVVGALTGESDGSRLQCLDHTGRAVEITAGGGAVAARYLDDGTAAPPPVGWLAPDPLAMRDLMVVTAEDLGPSTTAKPRDDDPPVLVEARAKLQELGFRLQEALVELAALEAAEQALAAVDERIRTAEEDAARREYARVLGRLERVRAEASAHQAGVHGAEADRLLLASAERAGELVAVWRRRAEAVAGVADDAGPAGAGDDELDPDDLDRLAAVPAAPPDDLPALAAEAGRAARHVAALEERVREVAGASLPEPEDHRVLVLATADQEALWAARDGVVEAQERVSREQVAVGGIGADGERAAAIAALEEAHAAAERARAAVARRRVPALAGAGALVALAVVAGRVSPAFGLLLAAAAAAVVAAGIGRAVVEHRRAAGAEEEALLRVGVPTYLGFHLRRVDATLDPSSLDRLGVATLELEAAERAWAAVAEGIDVLAATVLEPAVRRHAAALAARAGAVQEVAELRHALDELAVPDLVEARRRLAAAVAPYGITADDVESLEPDLVVSFVDRQVAAGDTARRGRARAAVERAEREAAAALEEVLGRHGFVQGDLDTRVSLLESALERAGEREEARATARPRDVVERELNELAALARRLRRPEWDDVVAGDGEEPDLAGLIAHRDQLAAAVAAEAHRARDVQRLADEHAAAERRVASLDKRLRGSRADDANVAELQRYLLAALTRANHVGPRGEPVPVVLDDPFVRVPAERKWELMDMLRRLSEKTQVLYLTDDPFIGAWARRRADNGAIRLLEPVE